MLKRVLAVLLASVFCFSLAACGGSEDESEKETSSAPVGQHGDANQTWAIYWYLCGSDLESQYGAATGDLQEMLETTLPDNVKVVIETGGASEWMNEQVDPSQLERYVYSSEGLELVDQQPLANMGTSETLADFLSFCHENYPADKTAVLFWNHGGGSVSGAAFDENFEFDSLTLGEFGQAFDAVFERSEENPPIDLVGFDTCLMATVDTAAVFSNMAKYMVASEEFEPGGGWLYSGWLQALGDDPGMDGALLGQTICDTYMKGCEEADVADEATLSLVDLSKIDPLLESYESMGAEALTYALDDPSFFGSFGREAVRSENYGGNTRDQGYANMVDLGHLAQNCNEILPEKSQKVIQALDDCVLYKVNGPYRDNAMGLSCYFSYNGDLDDFEGYKNEGYGDSFKYFFDYGLEGEFSQEGMDYINSLGYEEDAVQEVPDLETSEDMEYPLELDDDGYATLTLEPDVLNMLKGVYFQMAYVDESEDVILMLGQDNDIEADWDNGVFKDNFRDVWGSIDGHIVYMEISYECDDYTAYSVPILLNGEEYNLSVTYDYNDEEFYILGARKGLEDNGMADKNLVQLKPGDEITTVHYASSFSGDDDFAATEMETFTVTEDTSFGETELGDGVFVMMFELVDGKNNEAYSQMIQFTVEGENTDVEILE